MNFMGKKGSINLVSSRRLEEIERECFLNCFGHHSDALKSIISKLLKENTLFADMAPVWAGFVPRCYLILCSIIFVFKSI